MISFNFAKENIENLKKLDVTIYGETKGELRKYIVHQLEKFLFDHKISCPEDYLQKFEKENLKEGEQIDGKIIIYLNFKKNFK
jgi:hypothetical protein